MKGILVSEDEGSLLRRALAQKLSKEGVTQKKISSLLGITQPMVSKYLLSPIDYSGHALEEAYRIIAQTDSISFSCFVSPSQSVSELYGDNIYAKGASQGRQELIKELENAVKILRHKQMGYLLPKVKMNFCLIAASGNNAKDVASFPSGLVYVNGFLATYLPAEFGTSGHLAGLLIRLRQMNPDIRSMMNLKLSDKLIQKAAQRKMKSVVLGDDYSVPSGKVSYDLLMHKGSFGIEPAAYLVGINAYEVVHKCSELL